jgi:hypothetical protein
MRRIFKKDRAGSEAAIPARGARQKKGGRPLLGAPRRRSWPHGADILIWSLLREVRPFEGLFHALGLLDVS